MKIGIRKPPCANEMGFPAFCEWAAEEGFAVVDVPVLDDDTKKALDDTGLEVGTVDLPRWQAILSADESKRKDALDEQKRLLSKAAEHGAKKVFCVFLPEDHSQPRQKSFEIWKSGFPPVVELLDSLGMDLALEGWPGPAPWYPALGCTPETLRAMFAEVPSPRFGLNYDPSHLVRLGVDHIRFLWEFGDRVRHVHGKDTELIDEYLYLCGNIGPSFGAKYRYGDANWRYCIPGEGEIVWQQVLARLRDVGYDGPICVELEDHRYFPEVEKQQEGMVKALDYLDIVANR